MRCHPWRSPLGPTQALLKTAPGVFLCAAIHGAHLLGQRVALLKTAPGGFFIFIVAENAENAGIIG